MNPVLRTSTAFLLTAVVSSTSVMTGCKASTPNATGSQEVTQATTPAAAPPQTAPAAPPPLQMSVDDLVAPIALYPDGLLAQILTASANAQEVLDGGNWLLQNQKLIGDALTNAAKQAGFSPSMQYLMSFPQVVDNMCQQIDWTRDLGQAFQADQKGVMEAVQRKRAQAQQTGNLKSSPQMVVETKKADNGQQYVQIQPANPQVIYVPQYNPVTIYNTPAPATVVVQAPASTTTVVTEQKPGVSSGTAVAIGLLSFGIGMAVGSAINNNNYYPYPAWGYHGVYYGGRPYYPPPYRPVYPGYRPAYGYHPPPNYHWNQYNRNVNVTVNNNYYGQFNKTTVNNQNVNANNINTNNRPATGGGNQAAGQPNWKGQTSYQGARPNTANQKPGASMANANPGFQQGANRSNGASNMAATNRPATANQTPGASMGNTNPKNQQIANRSNAGNTVVAMNRPNPGATTGTGNMARPTTANSGSMNRPAAPSNLNKGGDRGYASAGPAATGKPAARPAPQQSPQTQNRGGGNNSAFDRSGSAKSERTASNRGEASMGALKAQGGRR
jgi:Protein of unknown function (DUF3300)